MSLPFCIGFVRMNIDILGQQKEEWNDAMVDRNSCEPLYRQIIRDIEESILNGTINITEAGGLISDLNGDPLPLDRGSGVLAADKAAYEKALEICRETA